MILMHALVHVDLHTSMVSETLARNIALCIKALSQFVSQNKNDSWRTTHQSSKASSAPKSNISHVSGLFPYAPLSFWPSLATKRDHNVKINQLVVVPCLPPSLTLSFPGMNTAFHEVRPPTLLGSLTHHFQMIIKSVQNRKERKEVMIQFWITGICIKLSVYRL